MQTQFKISIPTNVDEIINLYIQCAILFGYTNEKIREVGNHFRPHLLTGELIEKTPMHFTFSKEGNICTALQYQNQLSGVYTP